MATDLALRVASKLRSGLFLLRPSLARRCPGGFVSCYYSTTTTTPRLGFYVAASFSAKDRPFDPSTHVFHFDSSSVTTRRPDSGHDAFFVSRVNGSDAVAFGVADGVGGWTDSGVDPADFSHGLCNSMVVAAGAASSPLTARKLMSEGYDVVCSDKRIRAGGSTACVAIASSDGILDLANLGDSGFLQLRLNAVNAVSDPQTHAFNTPYQLTLIRSHLGAQMTAMGGSVLCDLPRDADVSQHRLRHGDVILLATDGLLDNLFHQDILRIASRVMVSTGAWTLTRSEGVRVADAIDTLVGPTTTTSDEYGGSRKSSTTLQSLLATELVTAAKAASVNTKVDGPFAKEVKRYYPQERWHGGKVDDICVVVAVVCEQQTRIKSRL